MNSYYYYNNRTITTTIISSSCTKKILVDYNDIELALLLYRVYACSGVCPSWGVVTFPCNYGLDCRQSAEVRKNNEVVN